MSIAGQNTVLNQFVPTFQFKDLQDGQIIRYDEVKRAFVNVGGGPDDPTRLGDLLNVANEVDDPLLTQNGQALVYNSGTELWENKFVDFNTLLNKPTSNNYSFIGLSDVSTPAIANGYVLWDNTGTNLVYSTTIPMANITGILPLIQGGTGATTQPGAANAVLPVQTSNAGKFLNTDGTNVSWNTAVTSINATTSLSGLSFTGGPVTTTGTLALSGTLGSANGGTGLTSVGTANQVLATNPTATGLEYKTISAGSGITVTPSAGSIIISANPTGVVTTFSGGTTGLTPSSPTSGIITLAGTLSIANGGTGLTSTGTANQFLATNTGATGLEYKTISAGIGISVTPGAGTFSIANTGVTSVSTAQPVAGLTIIGGPITTTGTLTFALANDLAAVEGLATTGMTARTATDTWTTRTITGTANRITTTNGDGVAGNPIIDISSSYVGQASITTVGTISSGIWQGTPVGATFGGTGQSVYAVGDILYANTTTTLAKLADVAAGSYLRSGGISTAPIWSTTTLPNSATTGDLLYASASNTYSNLADIATGNALISGGVGVIPSWGKIGLTTHVSGILSIANGGTNSGTALSGSSIMISNGTGIVQGAAGTTTTVLHGNASGAPTYGAVSLTTDVSGILGISNGGTGSSSQSGAANAILPPQAGNAGKFLVTDATNASWSNTISTNLLFGTDNTYDIGALAGTRPRNLYAGNIVYAGLGGLVGAGLPGLIVNGPSSDNAWGGVIAFKSFDGTSVNHTIYGSNNGLTFNTSGTAKWNISIAGHFLAATDNTYDIGTVAATRPRTGYFGTNVIAGGSITAGTAGIIQWTSKSNASSPTDGNILLRDSTNTTFGLLQLGGTTNAFPAIKRLGNAINIRYADDSDDAPLIADTITSNALSSPSISIPGLTVQALHRSPLAVTALLVYDTSKDSDGGAWIDRQQDKSWYNETLNGPWVTGKTELAARGDNLFSFPETLDDASWAKPAGVTITANTTVAPDGTTTADTINTTVGNQLTRSPVNVVAGSPCTVSMHVLKTSGATYFPVLYHLTAGNASLVSAVRLNTDTGVATVMTGGSFIPPISIASSDAGTFWRVSITATPAAGATQATLTFNFYPNMSAAGAVAAGSQVAWGIKLNQGPVDTYVSTSTQAATNTYFQLASDGKFYKLGALYGTNTEVFRGNKAKFPRLSAIVAETSTVTIYDLTETNCPMWMRFIAGPTSGSSALAWNINTTSITSLSALNANLAVGSGNFDGVILFNFASDSTKAYYNSTVAATRPLIIDRNNTRTSYTISSQNIGAVTVAGVAMAVLPNAPTDAVSGLQIPTIGVTTSAPGLSIIKPDGTISLAVSGLYADGPISMDSYTIFTGRAATTEKVIRIGKDAAAYALIGGNDFWSATDTASGTWLTNTAALPGPVSTTHVLLMKMNRGTGAANGIITGANGLLANISNTYNSGYMLGDIRRCWMSDITTGSVNGSNLITNPADSNFSSDTGFWNKDTGVTISGGNANWSATAALFQLFRLAFGLTVGKAYLVTFTITSYTLGGVTPNLGGTQGTTRSAVGTYSEVVIMGASNTAAGLASVGASTTLSITNLKISEAVNDRSYKAKAIAIYGTLTKTAVGTGNQLVAYSGFSNDASNPMAQKVTNGDFSGGLTGWTDVSTPTGAASIVGGKLRLTNGASIFQNARAEQAITVTPGKSYILNADNSAALGTGAKLSISIYTGSGQTGTQVVSIAWTESGSTGKVFVPTTSTVYVLVWTADGTANANGDMDNISVLATGADLTTANVLQEAYSADLDFGTGSWRVGGWVNVPAFTVQNGVSSLPVSNFGVASSVPILFNTGAWTKGTGWSASSATIAVCDGTQVANSDLIMVSGQIPATGEARRWTVTVTAISGTIFFYPNGPSPATAITTTGTYTGVGNLSASALIRAAAGTTCTLSLAIDTLKAAPIVDRSSSTGPSITLGVNVMGVFVATAYDGTTTRTVATASTYANGTFMSVYANYTANGAASALNIEVNGNSIVGTGAIAAMLTMNNTTAICTVGNNRVLDSAFPGSIALLRLGATIPTADQAIYPFVQEIEMFRDGSQITLPDSANIQDLAYDESLDKWIIVSPTIESTFTGLIRTSTTAVPSGSYTKVAAQRGVQLLARSTTNIGVDVSLPTQSLKEELVNRADAAGRLARSQQVFDFDATTTQTDFPLPTGYTALEVLSAGVAKREGSTKDWIRVFDGFKETIRFAIAPGAAVWVEITARRFPYLG